MSPILQERAVNIRFSSYGPGRGPDIAAAESSSRGAIARIDEGSIEVVPVAGSCSNGFPAIRRDCST